MSFSIIIRCGLLPKPGNRGGFLPFSRIEPCRLERIMTWSGFYGTRLSGSTYTVPRHKLDVFGVSLRRPLSPKGGEGTKKCQFMVRRSIEKQEMLNKPDDNLKVG